MTPTMIEVIGASLFAIAILHIFSTKFFEHLAHTRPAHAGLWHLLGEVEVVFGFWALVLVVVMFVANGSTAAISYIDSRNFTEPMFIFAIMVIAATRPILQTAMASTRLLARAIPLPGSIGSVSYTHLDVYKRQVLGFTIGNTPLSEKLFTSKLSVLHKPLPSKSLFLYNLSCLSVLGRRFRINEEVF